MIYLSRDSIASVVDLTGMIAVIEGAMALYDSKDFIQPDRITVNVSDSETYLYMPCFTRSVKGTKLLTLNQNNSEHGLPMLQGLMLLNNPQTGQVEYLLDGAAVTAYRTGAVGGTGVKYTTREHCSRLGLIGTGVQAWYQALYAAAVRPIEQIRVFDAVAQKAQDFAQRLRQALPQANVETAPSAAALVAQSELIITTTPAEQPVLPDDPGLLRGRHYVGIGSYKPTMREYPRALYGLVDRVYIDVDFAKEESGDLHTPLAEGWLREDAIQTLYPVISGQPIDRSGTTFYKSVGMAMFDIMAADAICRAAREQGIGQVLG